MAVLATLIFFQLGVIACLTSIITFAIAPVELTRRAAYTLVALLPLYGFFSTSCLFQTPEIIQGEALNFGTTAILNAVISQHGRCMYCATPFDILKPKKGHRYKV